MMDPLDATTKKVILVEGMSDMGVVETLARRHGHDLLAENIAIVPVGGATNFAHFLKRLGPRGRAIPIIGLIDAGEKAHLIRGLTQAGFGASFSDDELNNLGFFVCEADLEDEMIRAISPAQVLDIIENQRELNSFQTMQKQPQWRARSLHAQLQRFIGVKAGRKLRYGNLLAALVDLDQVPPPLAALLARL